MAPPPSSDTADGARQRLAAEWLAVLEHPPAAAAVPTGRHLQQEPQAAVAADATTANAAENSPSPPPPVDVVRSDECATDLTSFCRHEANVLTLLEDAPLGIDPTSVARAVKSVQLCLAKNVEALSSACIEALVADVVSRRHATDAIQQQQQQPATLQSVPSNAFSQTPAPDDEDSSVEVSIHYSKHHNSAGLRGHPALAAAAPAGEPVASLSSPGGGASQDVDIGSPLLWLLVFPFFCIGLYASYNHVVVYLRRRREALRIESKQYMPLP